MTKRILALILAVITVFTLMPCGAYAAKTYDRYTAEEALEIAMEAAGVEGKKIDYTYIDHEEDFKSQKYPVWEIKFGCKRTCYEYYVSVYSGEVLKRYTKKKKKKFFKYLFIAGFYKFADDFIDDWDLFGD